MSTDPQVFDVQPLAAAWLAWVQDPALPDYPLSGEEHSALIAWVHARMLEYVHPNPDKKGPPQMWDRESMAGWISLDLFGSEEPDMAEHAGKLCNLAKWPTEGEAK